MLTYQEIKQICRYSDKEVLAICPLCYSRCSETVCPLFSESENRINDERRTIDRYYTERQAYLNERGAEIDKENLRLKRWSDTLKRAIDSYKDLYTVYKENLQLVKTTFADFVEELRKGEARINELKADLKNDYEFINRYEEGRL